MTFIQYLKFIASYARVYKLSIFFFSIGIVLQVLYLLALPLAYQQIFDEAIPNKDFGFLFFLSLFLGAGLILKIGVEFITEYAASNIGTQIGRDLRLKLFNKLQRLHTNHLKNIESGKLIAHFSTDLNAIENSFIADASFLCKHVLLSICTIFLLFYLEIHMAILVVLLLPLPIIISHITSKKAMDFNVVKKNQEADIIGLFNQVIQEQTTIKAYNLQSFWFNKVADKLKSLTITSITANFLSSLVSRTMILSSQSIEMLIILTCAFFTIKGYLSIGTVIGFWVFFTYLSTAFDGTADLLPQIFNAIGGARRIQAFLETSAEETNQQNRLPFLGLTSYIEFRQVSFYYTDNKPVIRDLNFKIPVGKTVAFVGASGAGKSTILSLLLRLYNIQQGEILLNGSSIEQFSSETLRDRMRIVFQDNIIFNLSIADNIRLGKLDASNEEVMEAAKNAELHEFIMSQPFGYDTIVGERGGLLSGGQRQRLALARALVGKPNILLLDEVTSALDPVTENEINHTITRLMHQQTIIMITHRLYSVVSANCIYVLYDGNIIESGTHTELLTKQGYYKQLWEKQNS